MDFLCYCCFVLANYGGQCSSASRHAYNGMNVVGHHDPFVYQNAWKMRFYLLKTICGNVSCLR